MDEPILPTNLYQLAVMLGVILLAELRHYAPLFRRYFTAKVERAEYEIEGAKDGRDSDTEQKTSGHARRLSSVKTEEDSKGGEESE